MRPACAMTVISQHRFDPGPAELRRPLDDDALGQLVLGEAATKWYRTQDYYDTAAWRGTWALDGGSLINQGIHYADLLRWCMGPVAEVTASVRDPRAPHGGRGRRAGRADLRIRRARHDRYRRTAAFPGSAQRLEITGTDGTVLIEDGEITCRALRDECRTSGWPGSSRATRSAARRGCPPRSGPPGTLPRSPTCWRRSMRAASRRSPVEDGRDALELASAVYESAREGRTVVLAAASGDAKAAAG